MRLSWRQIFFSTLLAFALACIGAAYVIASDGATVALAATETITGPDGVCREITNTSPTENSLYIPTASTEEWQSFITNPPEGVTVASCMPPQKDIEPFVASTPCTTTSYVVPEGVTTLFVQLWGAGGGAAGGYTQGYLAVTPGETLSLMPGQGGQYTYNGWATACGGGGATYSGYGGGGRSAIRRGSTEIITAGGGGGSGSAYSGAGGGLGGGLTGSNGYAIPSCGTTAGRGGTQTAGGAGGNAIYDGQTGSAFQGGRGGQNSGERGGGGGGGYFGGGGGGARGSSCSNGDGGGGGSSYCGGIGVSQCVSYAGYGANKNANGRVVVTPVGATPAPATFSYTGADQTYTVPADTTTLLVQIWGAGAYGGHYTGDRHWGSNGGYTQGYLTVTPGEALTVIAGRGGIYKSSSTIYGGGGGSSCGAGGGGRSALRRGSSELLTAGGAGGGKGGSAVAGGAGGGSGENGTKCDPGDYPVARSGGSGGTRGQCSTTSSRWGTNGTAYTGGRGGPYGTSNLCGGGGGGGYVGGGGGGGGSDYSGSGAGGSGYCGGVGVSHCTTINSLGAPGGLINGTSAVTAPGSGRVIIMPFAE